MTNTRPHEYITKHAPITYESWTVDTVADTDLCN